MASIILHLVSEYRNDDAVLVFTFLCMTIKSSCLHFIFIFILCNFQFNGMVGISASLVTANWAASSEPPASVGQT